MTEIAAFKTFAKGKTEAAETTRNVVVYTRVSSSSQIENTSLETQRKGCIQYAERHGLTILKNFGQTNESASTDERAEFKAMIDFVKRSKERVSKILVYSLERFSRNENAIWLSTQLRKLGVEVVAVTQPIDTSSPSGIMQQRILMIFNQFDNELRKAKCNAGIREMLLQGNYPTRPPLGYDSIKINGQRTIVPNDKGRILRNAFIWKAQERLTDEAIRQRLARNGIALCHQRIGKILRNPFYCGLIVHRQLNGEVVPGNHEGIVSKELFLQVNGIVSQNTHGYTQKKENDAVPLKRFLRCGKCGEPLAGYLVKKKKIHYYKCSTVGCKTNRNAELLHERFAEILEYFSLDTSTELLHAIKQQAVATFNQYSAGYVDEQVVLRDKQKELQSKLARLEERLMAEEIPSELYYKYSAKYNEELTEVETELSKAGFKFSNLDRYIDMAIDFATGIAKKWVLADYSIKQRIQNLLFPEGMHYNRTEDSYRTPRINIVFAYLAFLMQKTHKMERGIPALQLDYASFALSVARRGIEPLFEE